MSNTYRLTGVYGYPNIETKAPTIAKAKSNFAHRICSRCSHIDLGEAYNRISLGTITLIQPDPACGVEAGDVSTLNQQHA